MTRLGTESTMLALEGEMGVVADVEGALMGQGVVLKYNNFTGDIWMAIGTEPDRRLDDLMRAKITVIVHDAKIKATAHIVDATLSEIALLNAFHPVQDYLKDLKWDGLPRIDHWLHTYMGADDDPWTQRVGAIFLIAAVRRVRQPGCKFDECLVLEGSEGLGKSETLRKLGAPWFSDSLPLGADPKVTVERTTNVWICESAELVGNSPSKISEIKSFLSRQEDGPFRAAYGRASMMKPRQFVPVATTNDSVFLHSTTGDRRFWPVKVYFASTEMDRDQLWAEAAAREAAGESIRLPEELWPTSLDKQEQYRVEDPWEAQLKERVGFSINLLDVWQLLGVPLDKATPRDAQRVAAIMMKLGYIKKRKKEGETRTTHYQKLTQFDPEGFDRRPENAPKDEEYEDAYTEADLEKEKALAAEYGDFDEEDFE